MKTRIDNCTWNSMFMNGGSTLQPDISSKSSRDYSKYFPAINKHKTIDIVQAAADFYLFFGICNGAIVSIPKMPELDSDLVRAAAMKLGITDAELRQRNEKVEELLANSASAQLNEIIKEAKIVFEDLVFELDEVFFQYTSAACGGELRHHSSTECLGGDPSQAGRHAAWKRWGEIYEQLGSEAFIEMIEIFLDFPLGSYGGPKWADAAQLAYDRVNMNLGSSRLENATLFVDRVFNMQHNTGCFLNKVDWVNHREDREVGSEHFLVMGDTVLAAHASDPADLDALYNRATPDAQYFMTEIMQIVNNNSIPFKGIWSK